jgi:phosphatidylinositol-3-phosphatase
LRRLTSIAVTACIVPGLALLGSCPAAAGRASSPPGRGVLPPGAIHQIMVIDLENESFAATFKRPNSYLSQVLEPQGELLQNYYAVGHVSLDNYIAQVSGQSPNMATNSDCYLGAYINVLPGTLDGDQTNYSGQVDGTGCVYPATVQTIGDQLDAAYPHSGTPNWRVYAEDMGNDPARDGGVPDPLGGTDCAYPSNTNAAGAVVDGTEYAEGPNADPAPPLSQEPSAITDQYATRHNPFVYFRSVTDDSARCDQEVVPLGTVKVGTNGALDTFTGHLAEDLATPATTPRFSFVVPNLCNDGHDSTCAGTNTAGGTTGGLDAVNLWLAHWMPLILNSPAYQSGHMLVVITADEGNIWDVTAGDNEPAGPNNPDPGYSPLLNVPIPQYGGLTYYQLLHLQGLLKTAPPQPGQLPTAGTMPGGGQVGALLLNPVYVHDGQTDTSGSYNHYSALRTYEDLLGLDSGGSDDQGHLGFAARATPFGADVFTLPTSG